MGGVGRRGNEREVELLKKIVKTAKRVKKPNGPRKAQTVGKGEVGFRRRDQGKNCKRKNGRELNPAKKGLMKTVSRII